MNIQIPRFPCAVATLQCWKIQTHLISVKQPLFPAAQDFNPFGGTVFTNTFENNTTKTKMYESDQTPSIGIVIGE